MSLNPIRLGRGMWTVPSRDSTREVGRARAIFTEHFKKLSGQENGYSAWSPCLGGLLGIPLQGRFWNVTCQQGSHHKLECIWNWLHLGRWHPAPSCALYQGQLLWSRELGLGGELCGGLLFRALYLGLTMFSKMCTTSKTNIVLFQKHSVFFYGLLTKGSAFQKGMKFFV